VHDTCRTREQGSDIGYVSSMSPRGRCRSELKNNELGSDRDLFQDTPDSDPNKWTHSDLFQHTEYSETLSSMSAVVVKCDWAVVVVVRPRPTYMHGYALCAHTLPLYPEVA